MSKKETPRLGQHWLQNRDILEHIVNQLEPSLEDYIVEVGPGLGFLTSHLLSRSAGVLAIEYDTILFNKLGLSFPNSKKLEIVNEDIRKFDFRKLPDKYLIATNLPYYISDYFLRLLTEIENKPCKAVILLQKEVVDKVSAEAGKDSTSALGLMLNYFYIVKGDVTVKASEFNPPPKIDSRLLVLELREKPLIEGVNFKDYVKLIKACFGSKRKNILNNLSSNLKLDKEEVKFKLDKLGIDHTIRAGKLDYSDWRLILNEF